MSEKPYRGFSEDTSGYYIGDKTFTINHPIDLGVKLDEWQTKMLELVDDEETNILKKQGLAKSLSKDILLIALEGFNYEEMLKTCTPKELEGCAGELYTFLYEFGSKREQELLRMRLTAIQKP